MTLTHFLLFGHILGAIIWLGSAVTLEIFGWRMALTKKADGIYEMASFSEWLGPRVFGPAAILTLVCGIALVAVGKPEFSQLWIIIALLGIILTGVIGGAVLGRTAHEILQAVKKKKSAKAIKQLYSRFTLFSRVDTALLFIILFDMVMKPNGSDVWFFVISLLFFLLVLGLAYREYQK